MWREACVAVLCAVVGGCAGTASHTPNRSPIQDTSARSDVLAVLPFAGHPGVRRGAGEWFAHKMQTSTRYRVMSPGAVETRLASDTDLGQQPIDSQEARRLGTLLGARVVAIGTIKSEVTGVMQVTLIDVSRGELVTRTSTSRIGFGGPYPTTVAAVEEVAQALLTEIEAADAKEKSSASGMK